MKKVGFIVNPVAGIGGKAALKGSDGADIVRKARQLGAVPESGKKALIAMKALKQMEQEMQIYTCPGEMGAEVCKAAGISYTLIRQGGTAYTSSADTRMAAQALREMGMDLILFAGGDGTARDIMDAVGTDTLVLGIPTGCKIHSGVYAVNPMLAGTLAGRYIQGRIRDTKEAEVMDIDEDLFRQGIVQARLYGYLLIPNEEGLVQNRKSGRGYSESASIDLLSAYIADIWEDDTLYIVGTGSTTAAIMKRMNLSGTLLGVDLVYQKKVIASDCTEKEILDIMEQYEKKKIIVTVIGGQGYIFGRGNQQISAEVIRHAGRENIIVAASKNKMLALFGKPLYADTGDVEINRYLEGYIRVVVGYKDIIMARVTSGNLR